MTEKKQLGGEPISTPPISLNWKGKKTEIREIGRTNGAIVGEGGEEEKSNVCVLWPIVEREREREREKREDGPETFLGHPIKIGTSTFHIFFRGRGIVGCWMLPKEKSLCKNKIMFLRDVDSYFFNQS